MRTKCIDIKFIGKPYNVEPGNNYNKPTEYLIKVSLYFHSVSLQFSVLYAFKSLELKVSVVND